MLYDPRWEKRDQPPHRGEPRKVNPFIAWIVPAFILGYTAAVSFDQIAFFVLPLAVGAFSLIWRGEPNSKNES